MGLTHTGHTFCAFQECALKMLGSQYSPAWEGFQEFLERLIDTSQARCTINFSFLGPQGTYGVGLGRAEFTGGPSHVSADASVLRGDESYVYCWP